MAGVLKAVPNPLAPAFAMELVSTPGGAATIPSKGKDAIGLAAELISVSNAHSFRLTRVVNAIRRPSALIWVDVVRIANTIKYPRCVPFPNTSGRALWSSAAAINASVRRQNLLDKLIRETREG
jgi:hypothetical protein